MKYRLCVNFLLAIQEDCWRIASTSGTDTGAILIKQHWGALFWGWFFLATLQSHLGGSVSLVSSDFFEIYTRGVWHCHSHRPKETQSGTVNSNWLYFAPTPWSRQGSKQSRKAWAAIISHLSSDLHYLATCHVNTGLLWIQQIQQWLLWTKTPPNFTFSFSASVSCLS